jgi:SAM-dependent methyltransferase
VILILVLLAVAIAFAAGGLLGAPYVPIRRRDSGALLELTGLKPGQTLVDLGSGDGQLLRLAASRGIRGIGYEINPVMVVVSRVVCWRYHRLVKIHLANLWQIPLPAADAVYVFLMPRFMKRLDDKLSAEIKQPTRVISYVFEIPGRTPLRQGAGSLIYEYGREGEAE